MARRRDLLDLPLLLAGVPGPVEEWLRQAGIPVARFGKRNTALGRVRPGQGRFVLFDGRNPSSRSAAETARSLGAAVIDVTSLMAAGSPLHLLGFRKQPGRSRQEMKAKFYRRLKEKLERLGGVWLRVADYPFPYRSALCTEPTAVYQGSAEPPLTGRSSDGLESRAQSATEMPETVCLRGDSAEQTMRDWLRKQYAAGLPVFAGETIDAGPAFPYVLNRASLGKALDPSEFPLLWHTTPQEFAEWWRYRKSLVLTVQRTRGRYRVECPTELRGFQPALELWRGEHVASFPLNNPVVKLQEEQLPFLNGRRKQIAGFAALLAEERFEKSLAAGTQKRTA